MINSSKSAKNKILVIAPHPDDEIIGCGGTIAKAIENKNNVYVQYLSSGDRIEKQREEEAKKVCSFMKITDYQFLRLKDQTFKVSAQNISRIIKYWEKIKPDFIYINHDLDADYEHKIAYQMISQAYWRYNIKSDKKSKGLILYEVHKPLQTYNLVEDITKYIEIKMKAMSFYKSQLKTSRIDLAIKGLNQYRGLLHEQCNFAEVFAIKRFSTLFET